MTYQGDDLDRALACGCLGCGRWVLLWVVGQSDNTLNDLDDQTYGNLVAFLLDDQNDGATVH